MAQTIIPSLWFDGMAEEAANFYTTTLRDGQIMRVDHYPEAGRELHQHEPGDVQMVEFMIEGLRFVIVNGGPRFKINPSVSFTLYRTKSEELVELWGKLIAGGSELMPLGKYPFSENYGWLIDKFGVSWQLMFAPGEHAAAPSLLFTQDRVGQAEQALRYYADTLPGAKIGIISHYPAGSEPDREGTLQYGDLMINEQQLVAMDSARDHDFTFSGAISLLMQCDTQEEIDALWERLSAVPEAEQCGWCQDKFGVTWQIAPRVLDAMLRDGTPEEIDRVTQAYLPMKKFDIAVLQRAFNGE
jgi:predicted 3-demethylubiquinone-9 3-methyltransferase (glyoxalase superfamily)